MEVGQFFNERRFSRIEEEFPDKNQFPLYYKANKTEITIGPGDGLFIPSGWFHFVFSEGDVNEAVNFWYHAPNDVKEGQKNKDTPIKFQHEIKELDLDPSVNVEVSVSTTKIVGTGSIKTRCADRLKGVIKTVKEFYEERNPHSYVVQSREFKHLDKYRISNKDSFKENSVWINFGDVYTHLHYDLDDNYLCQVKGTKRILLFPPEDRELLYLWNPYPLNIIFDLEISFFDSDYLHIKPNFIDNDTCQDIIANGVSEDLNKVLTSKYYSELEKYKRFLELDDAPIHGDEIKFTAVKTSELSNHKHKIIFQFAHVFILLENNTFRHGRAEFPATPGCIFVFPNSFIFKWWFDEGLVLVPMLIEEEDQKST